MNIFGYKPEFYIFANNDNINYKPIHICGRNPILVFFNDATPLTQSTKFDGYNKWIFFRATKIKDKPGFVFKDLSILDRLSFRKFFFIPDLLDDNFNNIEYRKEAEKFISSANCIENLRHLPKKFARANTLDYISKQNINLSSGFIAYIYIKQKYPQSKITLVGFSSDVDTEKHNANFEKGFFISEILNNQCETIECF